VNAANAADADVIGDAANAEIVENGVTVVIALAAAVAAVNVTAEERRRRRKLPNPGSERQRRQRQRRLERLPRRRPRLLNLSLRHLLRLKLRRRQASQLKQLIGSKPRQRRRLSLTRVWRSLRNPGRIVSVQFRTFIEFRRRSPCSPCAAAPFLQNRV
jgi:hypothetical protein